MDKKTRKKEHDSPDIEVCWEATMITVWHPPRTRQSIETEWWDQNWSQCNNGTLYFNSGGKNHSMRYEQIVQGNSSGRTELGPLSHNIVQKKIHMDLKIMRTLPLLVVQLVGALSHTPKGCRFNSRSWHILRLWIWSFSGHVHPFLSDWSPLSLSLLPLL